MVEEAAVKTDSEVFAFAESLRTVLEQARSLTNEIELTLVVLDAHERSRSKQMGKDLK